MGGLRKNYTGLVFNQLTAIEFNRRYKNKTYWNFKCKCGNIIVRSIDSVKHGNCKSCGCFSLRKRSLIENNSLSFTNLYHRYKTSSKQRKIEFNLSKDEFKKFTSSNCYYCGIAPLQVGRRKIKDNVYLYNGIDRLDNNKGYLFNNVKPCCFICNRAKRDLTLESFLQYLDRIKKHIIT
jgi:hypothetical protein